MKYISFLILAFFITACSGQKSQSEKTSGKLWSVELSPGDSQLVFSYSFNGKSSIYTYSLNDKTVQLIASSNEGEDYIQPSFSPDGKFILFISLSANTEESAIFAVNVVGHNKEQLTEYKKLITDATFSEDGNKVLYVLAKEVTDYSTLAFEAAHNMDIYTYNIENKTEEKQTNLNAYSITNLRSQGDSVIYIQNLEGPYFYKWPESKKINKIMPVNSTDVKTIGCSDFGFKKNQALFFITGGGYQLYEIERENLHAKLILHTNFKMENLNVFQKSDKIIFTRNLQNDNSIVIYDYSTLTFDEISITPKN